MLVAAQSTVMLCICHIMLPADTLTGRHCTISSSDPTHHDPSCEIFFLTQLQNNLCNTSLSFNFFSGVGWGGESFLSYHHVQAVSNLLSLFSGGGSALGDAAGRLGRGEDVHLGAL